MGNKILVLGICMVMLLVVFISGCDEEEGEIKGDSHFGVCGAITVFPNEMAEAGIGATRQWIRWETIEPEDDVYNWTVMDDNVQKANENSIEILGYFYHMPLWAMNMSNPRCNETLKDYPPDPCEICDWDDYTEFARNVAERYDGKHGHGEMKYIELWNEVQGFALMDAEDYGPWLIKGYQAVKEGNPNAVVLLGATHAPLDFPASVKFIDYMLKDYNQYYDVFNFHIYQKNDSAVLETIQYIKQRMETYHVEKPLWITETATFFPNVICNNLKWYNDVAKGVIKRYAQALGNGVEKVFWYSFLATPTIEEDPRGANCNEPAYFLMGGLGWDIKPEYEFHPRPAYDTYKLMLSKLSGFNSVERITDTQYKFIVNNKPVYVLWSDSGIGDVPTEIKGVVKVTNYLGDGRIMQANQITLTESPVFVEGI
jgi:hypothetical protein